MEFISPSGPHIRIVAITKIDILLIVWHLLLIRFQGLDLIDKVLDSW